MKNRLVYLDVLRAAAIVLVIGRHQPPIPARALGASFFEAWHRCGWVGVDLFFCLSGFLIGGLLFDEHRRRRHIDLRRFYVRRAFKIWPSYLLFVFVATAARFAAKHPRNRASMLTLLRELWPNFLHVQNYFGTPWVHTWSLAVEEHFYLVLPLLLMLLMRRKSENPFRIFPLILILLLSACLALRLLAAHSGTFDQYRMMYPTHLRIDSLFAGVALAYAAYYHPAMTERLRPWRLSLLALGLACFAPAAIWDLEQTPFLYTWGLTLLIFGSLCITAWSWFASTGARPATRPFLWLAAIGAYSYSIYLWHDPFAQRLSAAIANRIVPPADARNRIILMICFVGVAVLLGVVLYTLVEWPMLALRDRWYPSRSARTVPGAAEPTTAPPPGAEPLDT